MNQNASGARVRRGRRIRASMPIMLHWRESQGPWREIPAETKMLSRHGCLLACSARIKLSDEVNVWWMETMRYAEARVVFRKLAAGEAVEVALEFLESENFWDRDFSAICITADFHERTAAPSESK